MALVTFLFFVASIRTNICLFLAFFLLTITFCLFSGIYFQLALGNIAAVEKLQTVSDPPNSSIHETQSTDY